MRVVSVGCGRVGARLATRLDKAGYDVAVVDMLLSAFRRLDPAFGGTTIMGTGIDEDVLRTAGIEGASAFVAVTNGDNRNIMAAQVARNVFGIRDVVCRIYDPIRAETYRSLGYTVVCPTVEIADTILGQLPVAGPKVS
jgi:trk system potassium uptake protein TrkA